MLDLNGKKEVGNKRREKKMWGGKQRHLSSFALSALMVLQETITNWRGGEEERRQGKEGET